MKKVLVLFVFVLGVSICDTIGFIDSQQIMKQYNKAITAQTELAKKQKEFQDLVISKQQELEKAKTASKSEEELIEMKDLFESTLQPKKEELVALNQKLSSEIEKDLVEAAKKIAKQLRIDVVLDKQAVLVGGMDLTSLVISNLNK